MEFSFYFFNTSMSVHKVKEAAHCLMLSIVAGSGLGNREYGRRDPMR
jgi:hypothetical protein